MVFGWVSLPHLAHLKPCVEEYELTTGDFQGTIPRDTVHRHQLGQPHLTQSNIPPIV